MLCVLMEVISHFIRSSCPLCNNGIQIPGCVYPRYRCDPETNRFVAVILIDRQACQRQYASDWTNHSCVHAHSWNLQLKVSPFFFLSLSTFNWSEKTRRKHTLESKSENHRELRKSESKIFRSVAEMLY